MDWKILSVATDSSGSVFVSGYTQGGLGSDHLGNANTQSGSGHDNDSFVTKYNSAGVIQWTEQNGNGISNNDGWSSGTLGHGVATDSRGNVFVTGETDVGLDGNILSDVNSNYFFVTKYSNAGVKQ